MDLPTILLLSAAAFGAGFVDAVAGGGGLIVVPALLTAGLPAHTVLGTAKLCGTFGTAIATVTFLRKGLLDPARWRDLMVSTALGALFGTIMVQFLSAAVLRRLLPLAVLAAAIYMVLPHRVPAASGAGAAATGGRRLTALLLGWYDGFVGPGTGAFWTGLGMRVFRLDIVAAAGLARYMNLSSNVAALLTFAAFGRVDVVTGAAMGVALTAGAWLGAHAAIRAGGRLIRPLLLTVVVLMAIRLLMIG